jgi:hypothetical protein
VQPHLGNTIPLWGYIKAWRIQYICDFSLYARFTVKNIQEDPASAIDILHA